MRDEFLIVIDKKNIKPWVLPLGRYLDLYPNLEIPVEIKVNGKFLIGFNFVPKGLHESS